MKIKIFHANEQQGKGMSIACYLANIYRDFSP